MPAHPKDITGLRFGSLVAITLACPAFGRDGRKLRSWECLCDCGRQTSVLQNNLSRGNTTSCGCGAWRRLRAADHGQAAGGKPTPEYYAWAAIKQRCLNPKNHAFADYGGRGITVCDEWKNDFKAFLAAVGPRPSPTHSIDRTDNDRGYEPGNVRWATKSEQTQNRRPFRSRRQGMSQHEQRDAR